MPILVLFLAGLMLLVGGGELLVRGASRLALSLGVSALVVGLTVVAFGTSAPELAVSVQASLSGETDIAVGNVVGSNIFNVLMILGLSALIVPLAVSGQLVRLDLPIMIGVSFVLLLFAHDGTISRAEGAVFVLGALGYNALHVVLARRSPPPATTPTVSRGAAALLADLGMIAAGLLLLILGSRWLVQSAVVMARALGATELVIGLTIVAVGTSLPEVVTSIIAAIRGERDIAVGNVVGSNIFNILIVLGAASLTASGGLEVPREAIRFDIPVMVAAAVMCLPVFFSAYTITRIDGLVLFGYYLVYTVYLILTAGEHASLPAFRIVFGYVLIPASLLYLLSTAFISWRREHTALRG